jgi:ATP-binding cassette, subfamily B, multidrug efflux pump
MARLRYFEDEEITEVRGSTLWRVLGYLKPYRARVALALVLVIFAALAAQMGPYLIKVAIDVYMPTRDFAGIVRIAVLYAGLLLLAALCVRYRLIIMVKTGNLVIEKIRKDAFSHTNRLSFKFFDERPAGKIIVRIMNNVDQLQQLVKHGVINIVSDMVRLGIILGFMVAISPRLTVVALVVTPFLAVFVFILKKRVSDRWALFHTKNSNINAFTHESLLGIKVTQSFVQEDHNSSVMADQLGETYQSWMRATRMSSLMFPAVLIFNAISVALVYLVGYRYLGLGTVTIGTLIAFGSYVWMITDPIVNLSNFYNQILVSLAAAQRVFDILDTRVTVVNKSGAYDLPRLEGRVQFDDVHFSYDDGVPIFAGMGFRVEPGETIALVGETGAGKSTIVNVMSRFYEIQSGRVLVDDHDIQDVSLESLRGQIGVMMQDPFVFSGTIEENIRYGRLNATDKEVQAAARAVHAHEFIEQLPDGYNSEVNERGNRLSVGQRQLLAFARTLLYDPRILILDEATASVDTQTERRIQAAIGRLLAGRTAFVVAHRLSTIRNADRIMVIHDGEVIEVGSHDELLRAGGKYAELHASQYAALD